METLVLGGEMNPITHESPEWKELKENFHIMQVNLNQKFLEDSRKVFVDMYLGDGKENPSMTSRMSLVEEAIDRWSKDFAQTKRWLFGILASLIINIILHFWK